MEGDANFAGRAFADVHDEALRAHVGVGGIAGDHPPLERLPAQALEPRHEGVLGPLGRDSRTGGQDEQQAGRPELFHVRLPCRGAAALQIQEQA